MPDVQGHCLVLTFKKDVNFNRHVYFWLVFQCYISFVYFCLKMFVSLLPLSLVQYHNLFLQLPVGMVPGAWVVTSSLSHTKFYEIRFEIFNHIHILIFHKTILGTSCIKILSNCTCIIVLPKIQREAWGS